jgi:hypothetical protein
MAGPGPVTRETLERRMPSSRRLAARAAVLGRRTEAAA